MVKRQLSNMHMDTHTSGIITTAVTLPATAKIHETLNILIGGIEALNDHIHRFTNELLQSQIRVQMLIEDFSQTKLSVEESHSLLQTVRQNQDRASFKEQVDNIQLVSYDGICVWKITKFREKMSK